MSEGDDSFGYEYDEPDEYGGGEDEQEIEIENAYYEADGLLFLLSFYLIIL